MIDSPASEAVVLILESPRTPLAAGNGNGLTNDAYGERHKPLCRCWSSVGKVIPNKQIPRSVDDDAAYVAFVRQKIVDKGMGAKEVLDIEMFKNLLGIEQEFYADRLFNILDYEQKGYLIPEELLKRLSGLANGCFCQKFKVLFDIYDANGNGSIEQEEFTSILKFAIAGNALAFSTQQVEHLTQTLFDTIDKNNDEVVSYDEFKAFLDSSPELLNSLEISISRFLCPPKQSERLDPSVSRDWTFRFLTPSYFRRSPREAIWGWMFILSVLLAFVGGALVAYFDKREYLTAPCIYCYIVAKGFGNVLNWTSTLAVASMLKELMTVLRNTGIGRFLPVDSSVYAHKINGYIVALSSSGHIIIHFVNYGCKELNAKADWNYQDTSDVADQPTILSPTPEIISGWVSVAALILIVSGSLPCVRRTGHFQIFFYTHLIGYSVYYIMLLIHTRNHKFWKFVVGPGTLYLLEKAYSTWMIYRESGYKVMVRKVVQWPSGVTQLVLDRPPYFVYNSGDYIQINVPSLAWSEWHPFTLSSCPEEKDYLSLHIRCAGDWTRRLHDYFSARLKSATLIQSFPKASTRKRDFNRRARISILHQKRHSAKGQVLRATEDIMVHIKGPYGTPSGRIFEAQHAVLICAGIGVTPFASILQSIVVRHRLASLQTGQQSHEPVSLGLTSRLIKVDFIWVVKNQRNLEWFVELLEELDAEQHNQERFDQFLKIQIYLTSSTKMDYLHAFALTSALETFYKKYNRDLITGIGARAIHGRPNWQTLFKEVEENPRGEVSVFYCGPHPLSRELRRRCNQHKFRFFKESF